MPRYQQPAKRTQVDATSANPVPPTPDGLTDAQRARWAELWSSGVGALWDPVLDLDTVRCYLVLVDEIAASPGSASMYGQLAAYADRLGLSLRARRQMSVAVRKEAPPLVTRGADRPDPRLRAV